MEDKTPTPDFLKPRDRDVHFGECQIVICWVHSTKHKHNQGSIISVNPLINNHKTQTDMKGATSRLSLTSFTAD